MEGQSTVAHHPNLYLIGLTGNIACGKSTVIDMLATLGAHTIDADRVTHRLQQPGTPVYDQIISIFGPQIVSAPGESIDRRKLGAIVFSDAAALQTLERIVHPAVHAEIEGWLDQVGNGAMGQSDMKQVAVIDAIKLLETGWKRECDAIWVVTCTPEQQVDRLMSTRNMSEAEARQRIAAQSPQADKVAQADVVIDNSGSQDATRSQVEMAMKAIGDGG